MQKRNVNSLFFKLPVKTATSFKIIAPILLGILLFSAFIVPLHALTPARDLTGTWTNSIAEKYYDLDPGDPTTRMNDALVKYSMVITQSGSSIGIVLNGNVLSYSTDPAYWAEYEMNGVQMVGGIQIIFSGTVSGASFSADEQYASTGNAEHLEGTFTTDIITATLTGPNENTDTNGIIVLRGGSSATMPPFVTATPAPTPTPPPALPTAASVARVSQVSGSPIIASSGASVTTQTSIGTGAEIQTGTNGMVAFDYSDNAGTVYLDANSDAAWVYPEPQTDPVTQHINYIIVPSPETGTIPFSEGVEADEFGQVGITLPIEIGVGMLLLGETLPIALTGAAVVEGTLLLGTGIAYVHEQLSPQDGTCDVRPVQVPQGMVMGAGTDYVVTVSNGATTIQVIDGSVIFVDQYTNNTVTIAANQMLTLPTGTSAGFSTQELQSYVTAFDASSINQWWIQPVATATSTATATSAASQTAPSNTVNGTSLFNQPAFLVGLIMVIAFFGAAIVLTVRKRKASKPSKVNQQTRSQSTAQPVMYQPTAAATQPATSQPKRSFCPNCGNQLLSTKGSCPFCNADLSQFYPNTKK